jgi:hypothetical protein
MQIDEEGNLELTAEENQALMDHLEIPESQYDDPPVEIEYTGMEDDTAKFKVTNTETGKTLIMEFDLMEEPD